MSRRQLTVGGVLFTVALVARCVWILLHWSQCGPEFSYADEDLHWQLATNLVHDGALVTDDGRYAARMPLYPLFLAPFAALGPTGVLFARLAQALLGALTTLVALRFARLAFGPRGGLLAGILVALDPFAIFFANLLLTEVLFTLLLILWLYLAIRLLCAARHPDHHASGSTAPSRRLPREIPIRAAILFALGGTLALLTRPSVALLLPLVWLLLWRYRVGWHTLLLSPAAVVIFLLPWGLRNVAVIGGPAWLSANGGVTLYDAQGPQADGSSDQSFLADMPELNQMGELERDRVLQRRAIHQMQSHPARVMQLAWVKLQRTWSLTPNVAEHSHGATAFASAAYTLIVLLGAFVGLWRSLRHVAAAQAPSHTSTSGAFISPRCVQALLWAPVLYFTLLHCVYIGSLRYRVPLMPVLAIAAAPALGTDRAATFHVKRRRSGRISG